MLNETWTQRLTRLTILVAEIVQRLESRPRPLCLYYNMLKRQNENWPRIIASLCNNLASQELTPSRRHVWILFCRWAHLKTATLETQFSGHEALGNQRYPTISLGQRKTTGNCVQYIFSIVSCKLLFTSCSPVAHRWHKQGPAGILQSWRGCILKSCHCSACTNQLETNFATFSNMDWADST